MIAPATKQQPAASLLQLTDHYLAYCRPGKPLSGEGRKALDRLIFELDAAAESSRRIGDAGPKVAESDEGGDDEE